MLVKLPVRLFVLLCALAILCAPAVDARESFAPLVQDALPAVVNISTTQSTQVRGLEGKRQEELEKFLERFGFPQGQIPGMPGGDGGNGQREVSSLGSGFVIDPDGYVVTNNHVIAEASEIVVTFADDTQLDATVIGRDPKTDLALLKVDAKKPLAYVEFGDSDAMRVGDWVIAIGNPFGLGSTVTAGIISARSRNINAGPFDDFLQSDAAINRGNSGGPMFNDRGDVIGVNTAIFSPSGGNVGIGFAIPSAMAKPILDQLREHGRTYRGWLGVKIQHVTDEIAESLGLNSAYGALVLELTPDGPADNAGIQPGDVIISFDGKKVKEMRNLPRMVAETPVGQQVNVGVWRGGKKQNVSMALGEFPQEASARDAGSNATPDTPVAKAKGTTILGMVIRDISARDRARLSLDDTVKGVLVTGRADDSDVAQRSVRKDDVITGVNQSGVSSLSSFKTLIDNARETSRDFVLLRVLRGGNPNYVTVPINE